MSFSWSYILTWRLVIAILLWLIAGWQVMKAYRRLRIGDVWNKGTVEEVFISSLLVSMSIAVYPFFVVGIPILWYLFLRKHILSSRGFAASLLAIALVTLYCFLYHYWMQVPFWPWGQVD